MKILFPNRPEVLDMAPPVFRYYFRKHNDDQIDEVCRKVHKKNDEGGGERNFYLCKDCSFVITSKDRKVDMAGQHSHVFRNPIGVVYRIGCFSGAPGCVNFGEPTLEHTWFPGYSWSFATCMKCMAHLGWFYQSGDSRFYGLILHNLIEGEKKSENL